MKCRKLRIGHIGTAHDHSSAFFDCIKRHPELFEIVGVVEPDPLLRKRAQTQECFQNVTWMTEEELAQAGVDAVLIETFELDLIPTAIRWAERGIHLHIDKPAGENLAKFSRLLDIAREKSLVIQMGYMYRYNKAVQYTLELARSGMLGEIYQIEAIMNTCHPAQKREWLSKFQAGSMFYLGCHMIDLIYLFQGMPKNVIPYNRSTGFDQVNCTDFGMALLEYDHGISIAQSTSVEVNGYGRRRLAVYGSKGTVEIRPLECPNGSSDFAGGGYDPSPVVLSLLSDSQTYRNCQKEILLSPQNGRYDDMMTDFYHYVIGNKKNPYDYNYEYQVHKLVLAACGVEDHDLISR